MPCRRLTLTRREARRCSHSMQMLIGRTYVEDPGFRKNHKALAPGLEQWMHEVIDANARRHGVDPATATWA
nr:TipAS antibiotic-recognition domain-containing protein [Nocardiopsis kunsanensis]